MTLVLGIIGPRSLWLLADRRLSSAGRIARDDATKILELHTVDGQALLAYAGLGATGRGMQPSEWMSNVLRGRNANLEQSLGFIANATKTQLPNHLLALGRRVRLGHTLVAIAYVEEQHRLYTIDLVSDGKGKLYHRYTRHLWHGRTPGMTYTPRMVCTGSGAAVLTRHPEWMRHLLRLSRAYDRGLISPKAVADYLAEINDRVYSTTPGGTVGPRCIVVYRNTADGPARGGGAHFCYDRRANEDGCGVLPSILNGRDFKAVAEIIMAQLLKTLQEGGDLLRDHNDTEATNEELGRLPEGPDEELR